MMLTEAQAKNRWCPYARVPSNGVVANRDNPRDGLVTTIAGATYCMGSACMAWRWETVVKDTQAPRDLVEFVQTGRGYCGLAGMPMLDRMP